jgi:hypothetical protein
MIRTERRSAAAGAVDGKIGPAVAMDPPPCIGCLPLIISFVEETFKFELLCI